MSAEKARYSFGDASPESFEDDKEHLLAPDELEIGSSCVFRLRWPPVAGVEYIGDYLVQIADVRMTEGRANVEVVYLQPRDENWAPGLRALSVDEAGIIMLDNVGPDRIKDWEEGDVDVGYLLPYVPEP